MIDFKLIDSGSQKNDKRICFSVANGLICWVSGCVFDRFLGGLGFVLGVLGFARFLESGSQISNRESQ